MTTWLMGLQENHLRKQMTLMYFSVIRAGSAFKHMIVICMCSKDLASDIFQRIFILDTYRPNHWYHGVGYHKLQCTHIVRVCRGDVKHHHVCWRLFNRFYWYSCSTKAMCCSSKIMPIYIMPLLLKIFWNMVANFPGWHDCHNLPHPH